MISFVKELNQAIIFNDVGSEDGWIFKYDSVTKKFLVWDNIEREIQNKPPLEFDTLEEVLDTINSYT